MGRAFFQNKSTISCREQNLHRLPFYRLVDPAKVLSSILSGCRVISHSYMRLNLIRGRILQNVLAFGSHKSRVNVLSGCDINPGFENTGRLFSATKCYTHSYGHITISPLFSSNRHCRQSVQINKPNGDTK